MLNVATPLLALRTPPPSSFARLPLIVLFTTARFAPLLYTPPPLSPAVLLTTALAMSVSVPAFWL